MNLIISLDDCSVTSDNEILWFGGGVGFSVHEIVLRRRLKSKGSKYNDGYIGIKALPIRSQNTIINGFLYSDDGRKVVAIRQYLNKIASGVSFEGGKVDIPFEEWCDGESINIYIYNWSTCSK